MTEVRFELDYEHPPERVWRAFTDPETMGDWLAPVDRLDGGYLLSLDGLVDGPVTVEVQESEPPVRLVMRWLGEQLRLRVIWELAPTPTGCRATISFSGFLGLPVATRHEQWRAAGRIRFDGALPVTLGRLQALDAAIAASAAAATRPVRQQNAARFNPGRPGRASLLAAIAAIEQMDDEEEAVPAAPVVPRPRVEADPLVTDPGAQPAAAPGPASPAPAAAPAPAVVAKPALVAKPAVVVRPGVAPRPRGAPDGALVTVETPADEESAGAPALLSASAVAVPATAAAAEVMRADAAGDQGDDAAPAAGPIVGRPLLVVALVLAFGVASLATVTTLVIAANRPSHGPGRVSPEVLRQPDTVAAAPATPAPTVVVPSPGVRAPTAPTGGGPQPTPLVSIRPPAAGPGSSLPIPPPTVAPVRPKLQASYAVERIGLLTLTGYRTTVRISNHTDTPATGWRVTFTLPEGQSVVRVQGAEARQSGRTVTLTPSGTGDIPGRGSVTLSFEVDGLLAAEPANCTLDGQPCG